MKRIQIGAVLGWVAALGGTGCSPVGDASGPDWFVVPDRFTGGLPDASAGSGGTGLSEDNMLEPLPSTGSGGSGGAPNGGSGGSTLGDAGTETPDGGPPAPFGIGDPWYFDSASDLDDFQIFDWQIVSTTVWSPADAAVASGHLKITVPFTPPLADAGAGYEYEQKTELRFNLANFTDFTGRVLKVRVKRLSGAGPGGVQGFVQSGDPLVWVSGTWNNLDDLSELTEVTLDFNAASQPTMIKRFGIQIHAGSSSDDAQTNQVAIDDFRIE